LLVGRKLIGPSQPFEYDLHRAAFGLFLDKADGVGPQTPILLDEGYSCHWRTGHAATTVARQPPATCMTCMCYLTASHANKRTNKPAREKAGTHEQLQAMSALGQKRTHAVQQRMSALPPKADMCGDC
jgi:hypothetical protein